VRDPKTSNINDVLDLSILPRMVAGNTYSTALVIGAKAAQIISGEVVAAGEAKKHAESNPAVRSESELRARL
jgi:hypothetical protein